MKSNGFDRLVASTALGVILALSAQPLQAQAQAESQIEAGVPIPDTTIPPPLTVQDIAPGAKSAPKQAAAAAPKITPAQIDAAIPKPDTTPLPPLTAKDIATSPASAAPTAANQNTNAPKTLAITSPTADKAVAARLRDIVTGRLDRMVPRKEDRAGVQAFYQARDYKPLWVSDGKADTRAQAAMDYLAHSDADGLEPSDYPRPNFKVSTTAEDLAKDELKLTNSVLTYARDAQIGRIHFSRVGSDISFKLVPPE
ncbi:MAG: L,D-transpeptidase family protein, partial [Candidatus Binataceae bacterium]